MRSAGGGQGAAGNRYITDTIIRTVVINIIDAVSAAEDREQSHQPEQAVRQKILKHKKDDTHESGEQSQREENVMDQRLGAADKIEDHHDGNHKQNKAHRAAQKRKRSLRKHQQDVSDEHQNDRRHDGAAL